MRLSDHTLDYSTVSSSISIMKRIYVLISIIERK